MIQITKNNTSFNISDKSINTNWFINNYQTWEPHSFKVIDDLLNKDKTFIDIGSWIGPILLYVAPKVKRIIGVDCDILSFDSLIKNVNCNKFKNKVQLEYAALYNKNKKIYVGGGKRHADWGSSEIMITDKKDNIKNKVKGITIDKLIKKHKISDCGFIKIDIEGGEAYIIESMKHFFNTQNPILYISIHPHLMTCEQLENTIYQIFDIFPYVYDINYKLLNKKETIKTFLKNKIGIIYEGLASNIGHELIGSYYELPSKISFYKKIENKKTLFEKIFECIFKRKNKCKLTGKIEIV